MTNNFVNSSNKTLGLFFFRILRSILSIATLVLSAKYFGVSVERDAWLLAFNCLIVVDLAIWGPINETFRAKFIFIKGKEGEAVTIHRTASLFIFTSLISILLLLIILIFPDLVTSVIAPARNEADSQILIRLLRILAPSLLFNQTNLLLSSILNAYNIFYIPEIVGFISSILNIVFLIALVPSLGIYSLAVSYYLGLVILLGLLIYQVKKHNIPLFRKPIVFDFKYVKPYILFALPFFFPYFMGQLNAIAEKSFASLIGNGTVSIIDYSRRFIEVPIVVLTSVLSTILVPILSHKFAENNMTEFKQEFKTIFHLGLFLLGSLLTFFVLGASDVVTLLYNHKQMDTASLAIIAKLTTSYAVSGIAIYFYSIVGLSLLSANRAKVYAVCGVSAQLLMLLSNFLLYKRFGVFTFPVSVTLSHLAAALIMTFTFTSLSRDILKSALYYGLFTLLLVTIAYFSNAYVFSNLNNSLIISLILKAGFLTIVITSLIFLFKMDERNFLLNAVKKLKSYK